MCRDAKDLINTLTFWETLVLFWWIQRVDVAQFGSVGCMQTDPCGKMYMTWTQRLAHIACKLVLFTPQLPLYPDTLSE